MGQYDVLVQKRMKHTEGVVVGNVGGKTTEERRGASVLVDVGEELSGGGQVGGPTQPTSVTSIDVHVDTEGVEGLESVDDTLLVGALGARALGDVHVGDHVGERIGFDDSNNTDIGVL